MGEAVTMETVNRKVAKRMDVLWFLEPPQLERSG